MKIALRAERLMGMSDDVWLRHANPWSGWTRMTILPLWALAIWSRVWIGGYAWGAVALVLIWVWYNPRIFPSPLRFDNWMTRGVLGERVFLQFNEALPAHHRRMAILLGYGAVPGLFVLGWGLWMLDPALVAFGVILAAVPKLWFLDRMVWILEDWQRQGKQVPGLPQGVGDV
ncbi:MAG: DUF6653 family protein [Sulfitobacter sp.]